jgi:hypothetical protein
VPCKERPPGRVSPAVLCVRPRPATR